MDKKRKPRRAAALSYDPEAGGVPVMSAFGEGYLADKIIEAATESGVPIKRAPGLAAMLAKLSVGDEIPPQLYEVVARVLVFVSEVDHSYGRRVIQASERASRQDTDREV